MPLSVFPITNFKRLIRHELAVYKIVVVIPSEFRRYISDNVGTKLFNQETQEAIYYAVTSRFTAAAIRTNHFTVEVQIGPLEKLKPFNHIYLNDVKLQLCPTQYLFRVKPERMCNESAQSSTIESGTQVAPSAAESRKNHREGMDISKKLINKEQVISSTNSSHNVRTIPVNCATKHKHNDSNCLESVPEKNLLEMRGDTLTLKATTKAQKTQQRRVEINPYYIGDKQKKTIIVAQTDVDTLIPSSLEKHLPDDVPSKDSNKNDIPIQTRQDYHTTCEGSTQTSLSKEHQAVGNNPSDVVLPMGSESGYFQLSNSSNVDQRTRRGDASSLLAEIKDTFNEWDKLEIEKLRYATTRTCEKQENVINIFTERERQQKNESGNSEGSVVRYNTNANQTDCKTVESPEKNKDLDSDKINMVGEKNARKNPLQDQACCSKYEQNRHKLIQSTPALDSPKCFIQVTTQECNSDEYGKRKLASYSKGITLTEIAEKVTDMVIEKMQQNKLYFTEFEMKRKDNAQQIAFKGLENKQKENELTGITQKVGQRKALQNADMLNRTALSVSGDSSPREDGTQLDLPKLSEISKYSSIEDEIDYHWGVAPKRAKFPPPRISPDEFNVSSPSGDTIREKPNKKTEETSFHARTADARTREDDRFKVEQERFQEDFRLQQLAVGSEQTEEDLPPELAVGSEQTDEDSPSDNACQKPTRNSITKFFKAIFNKTD